MWPALMSVPDPAQVAEYVARWDALRVRLLQRYKMSREVLEASGEGQYAALIPIEEVLIWMDEIEGRIDVQ